MSDHAPLAPSAAKRWMVCPGSRELSAGLPDTDNDYAKEGSFAHEVAAHCLTCASNPDGGVTDEMKDAVGVYLRAVRSTIEFEGCEELMVEQRVRVSDDVWGTADALIWNRSALHVFDLKYGVGVWVAVIANVQAMIYALGALLTWPTKALAVDDVYIHIVQPRHHSGGRLWRTWHTSRAALLEWWKAELRPAVVRALADGAKRVPGDHCQFCPVKPTCPEIRERAMTTAATVFNEAARPPAVRDLTPEQLGDILAKLPLVDAWMTSLRSHCYELTEHGTNIPGFKRVRKTSNRKWLDEARAINALRNHDVDPYAEQKVVSPAVAEKRLGKKQKKIVALLTHKPVGGIALVPESDNRPAIGAVFSVLTDEESEPS